MLPDAHNPPLSQPEPYQFDMNLPEIAKALRREFDGHLEKSSR